MPRVSVAGEPPAGLGGAATGYTARLRSRAALQLRWLIIIRLILVTSIALPYFLLRVPALGFIYGLVGGAYLASGAYLLMLRSRRVPFDLQLYAQILGDLVLVTGLVYQFGGTTSPFSILYLLVITLASILLQRRGGLVAAGVAWVLYAMTVVALHLGWVASPLDEEIGTHTDWRIVYQLAVHLFGFFAVAVLTSRLAQSASRVERELEAKREDLAELQVAHHDVVESIPSGLVTTDRNGTITSANRAAQRILGRPAARLVGRSIVEIDLFRNEPWEGFDGEAGDSARREVDYQRGEDTLKIGYSVSPLTGAQGDLSGHIVIFQDLTYWRELQDELRLKDRMAAVGELSAGIAHEIGNPLAAISGSVQMLRQSSEEDDPRFKLLEIISRESQRLDRTIKGFLKFVRPKERSNVRFDIAALLAEHLELLRNSPEVSAEHQLAIELEPTSVSIVADPDQVSQIFWNLSRNALKAMPGGGTLVVRGTLQQDSYQIAFIDSGHGMNEEQKTMLFHPFHTQFDGGTGIGMAIVYRIVEEHGGRLMVESQVGRGTEIVVALPLEPSAHPVPV